MRLVEDLHPLHITAFGLSIWYTGSLDSAMHHGRTLKASSRHNEAERYLAEFDLDAFVELLRTNTSTLDTIVVTLEGVPGRPFAKATHGLYSAAYRMYTAEIVKAGGIEEADDIW